MREVQAVGTDPAEFKNHQLPLARIKKARTTTGAQSGAGAGHDCSLSLCGDAAALLSLILSPSHTLNRS